LGHGQVFRGTEEEEGRKVRIVATVRRREAGGGGLDERLKQRGRKQTNAERERDLEHSTAATAQQTKH
jgi:hypothetical protein